MAGSSKDEGHTDRDPGLRWVIFGRVLSYLDDIAAVLLIAASVVTLLGILGWTQGTLIDLWVGIIRRWFGFGALLFPIFMVFGAIAFYNQSQGRMTSVNWLQVIAIELTCVGVLGLLTILDGMEMTRAEAGYGGGLVGWGVTALLRDLVGIVGATGILLALTMVSAAYGLRDLLRSLRIVGRQLQAPEIVPEVELHKTDTSVAVVVKPDRTRRSTQKVTQRLPRAYRKSFKIREEPDEKPARSVVRDERLPTLDLFEQGRSSIVTAKEINLSAGLIEKTLADFGLPARVVDFRTGPAVTQFAVEPGFIETVAQDGELKRQKVRVSQISALASDLALTLSAPTLRIEAPVPGRAYVGIEVPNRKQGLVSLRPLLESKMFQSIGSPLAIALGRDVAGAPVAADLALMPHLLIAGTTGSGKSVCITAIASTLAFENSPEDLRLVLVDPKMVELIRFNGLPHLIGKVETDLERIIGVLRWCMLEMDRRYRLLEEVKARDIDAYNHRIRRKRNAERLPRIVLMIDELSDLMMMAPDQTERTLVRLAQMARAVGIHLVLATQRPSTDILTGLIKANFPARISFAVASSVDSRVILDTTGAETLLGRGDMLFLSPEAGSPVRLQGVYVRDQEIEKLIEYWREEVEEDTLTQEPPPWEDLLVRQAALGGRDAILEQAIELVKERGEASASMLQRGLRIGYPRAARLMDELEELGVVGRQQTGGRTREVLIGKDDDPLVTTGQSDEEAE
jgi:S-DNA-T family DNA segregation ATPase FtsK/SpoIIIE